jgi:1-phosphatidylinositol-3-phosphate 5-kinase
MIYGTDDDSSVLTEDVDRTSSVGHSISPGDDVEEDNLPVSDSASTNMADDLANIGTPSIAVPMSRKQGNESKRRSAVIEFDGPQHTLVRPSSSRSLRSLSGRPRSSSHKRHNSRHGHQHMKTLKSGDDRAPFQRQDTELSLTKATTLPTFHHDNIIDPDLAPFISDEGSTDDENPSIFATLNGEGQSPGKSSEKAGFAGLLASVRKGTSRTQDRHGVLSVASRDMDNASFTSRNPPRHNKQRALSVSSMRLSPRRSKSNSLLKGLSVGFASQSNPHPTSQKLLSVTPKSNSKMMRSAAMRGPDAPPVELNQASLQHVRKLLRQMLQDASIQSARKWEKALMPILLQCTDDVNPNIQRNDDIDIRHYIKLKKVPGGKPGDTSYVSGVVFTKNLALKSMPRSIAHPRIVIVTFAIEYARYQQHFMSLEPVLAQEREFLRNLVKRIVALNPQVLLVQKNVAGLALELLTDANVAVAYNVKQSVLNAVARCTRTKLITSVDKLNIDPSHVGRCASFDVKTYVHGAIKKTYIYLTGCEPDLGCTIVLRGAEMDELRRLKRITEFMCYVVYNLKLETCVMRDEYVLIPADPNDEQLTSKYDKMERIVTDARENAPEEQRIHDENEPRISQSPSKVSPSFAEDIVQRHKTRIVSSSPFVKFMQPYLLSKVREQEAKLERLRILRDEYSPDLADEETEEKEHGFELVEPEMIHRVVPKPSRQVREFLFAVHDAEYNKAWNLYLTLKRQWETSCGNTKLFDPFNHQRIAVLYSMVNTNTSNPCVGPDVIALSFYAEHDLDDEFLPDITLGQYVEDLCNGANTPCSAPGCEETMFNHHRQYVHGDGQMSVIVQKYPSRIRGMHNTILMWSCCRICGQETQVIPMSENTWKYSFGKYLELTFWSTGLHPKAHACPHDIHHNHVRFFGFNNVIIRIQYDPIILHEIIVPKPTINWKAERDLRLKNEQYQKFKDRLDKFMISVKNRIESIHVESVVPEKVEVCQGEVERLMKRANEDHRALTKNLQEKYMNSRYYEIIPLNRAGRAIHENSIAWDESFANFEQNFFPSERDIRKMAELQIRKMFIKPDETLMSVASVEDEEAETETEKKIDGDAASDSPDITKRLSVLSPEDTQNVLDSVLREQNINEKVPLEAIGAASLTSDPVSTTPATTPQPFKTPIESSESDEVKHLDLAVPVEFPNAHLTRSNNDNSGESKVALERYPGEPTEAENLRLSSQVNKVVEQIRNTSDFINGGSESVPTEQKSMTSRIPRPTETIRRDGDRLAPPLSRTTSQPQTSIISKLKQESVEGPSATQTPASSSSSKTDKFKNLITDARILERRMADRISSSTLKAGRTISHSLIPRSMPTKRHESRVSTLARHFEQLSREFEKQRMRERQLRSQRGQRAYPLASSKPIVEVYKDEHEAVQEQESSDEGPRPEMSERTSLDIGSQDQSSLAETTDTSRSNPDRVEENVENEAQETLAQGQKELDGAIQDIGFATGENEAEASDTETTLADSVDIPSGTETTTLTPTDSQLDFSVELPKNEKISILKLLTSFWSERSASGWPLLEYPFASYEHVWQDSDIIVREDEPSSIIALALSSSDYQAKMKTFRSAPPSVDSESEMESIERNLLHPKNTNIRYAFQNRGVRAQCKIFFAESFDALRRKTGVAERFVESLSRCLRWDSKGGKTKSLFLKTLDDRFVLKSLSPVEVNAFFKLAPEYFFFIHQNLFTQLPSVIAKIFGLFQVTIRNPANNMEFNWFMIVMENLFYERHTNRRFDLKGSMRNRKIQSTGEKDEVLLDENFIDIIFEKPIIVREHTMKTLKNSVYNDTLFLSKQNVMDYSLMAGFDDENRKIMVGIIDCIRTYTWDKKLETWIKDRGKNKPTVTSPKDYRNRFRIAMSKYILPAPDCWHQFQTSLVPARQFRASERNWDVVPEEQEVEIGG